MSGLQHPYGVLAGRARAGRFNDRGSSPHYEILVDTLRGTRFDLHRLVVNVRSMDGSAVLAYFSPDFTAKDLSPLARAPFGFTALTTGPGGTGIDYARDGLFDIAKMEDIPDCAPGSGNGLSLRNLLDAHVLRAVIDPGAVVIAYGQFFSARRRDPAFGFAHEQGLHDIHMMQGNYGRFAGDNRTHGDGALFIRYGTGTAIALFIRFALQVLPTDDATGDPSRGSRPRPEAPAVGWPRISAAQGPPARSPR
jgi:uncharacterized protein YukJ